MERTIAWEMEWTLKKARELAYLCEAIDKSAVFPPGEIVCCEPPDFLIRSGERVLGIEVVEHIRGQEAGEGSSLRMIEELYRQLAERARSEFATKSEIPLLVHIHACRSEGLTKRNVREL